MIYEVASCHADTPIVSKKPISKTPELNFHDMLIQTCFLEETEEMFLEQSLDNVISDLLVNIDNLINLLEEGDGDRFHATALNLKESSQFFVNMNISEYSENISFTEKEMLHGILASFNYMAQNILSDTICEEEKLVSLVASVQEFAIQIEDVLDYSNLSIDTDAVKSTLLDLCYHTQNAIEEQSNSFYNVDVQKDISNILLEKNSQKVSVQDLRTDYIKERESFFSTHAIPEKDNTSHDLLPETESIAEEHIVAIQESALSKVSDFAEKMYTSFSSPVSRVQVEALVSNISGRVGILLQDGRNELSMKLTPPELGHMKMIFTTEDNMMQGKIIVETQEAKSFFDQNIHSLRETLENSGVLLGHVSVELGSHSDFSDAHGQPLESYQAIRTQKIDEKTIARGSGILLDTLVDYIV